MGDRVVACGDYLWRAVDEDGDVIDILVQSRVVSANAVTGRVAR